MTTVAILGATGHIAKGLISVFLQREHTELVLFARQPDEVLRFIEKQGLNGSAIRYASLDSFGDLPCDAIVNAIGAGDPARVRAFGPDIIEITERFDDAVLNYLRDQPSTRYIFLSSGAIYGSDFSEPVGRETSWTSTDIKTTVDDPYAEAKRAAERKHRALPSLCIVDVRVFGYFSRFIDTAGEFFMADAARAILERTALNTREGDMMRDYAVPVDLSALIDCCIAGEPMNRAIDMFSLAPVGKFELLEHLGREFGLEFSIDDSSTVGALAGKKEQYYSLDRSAAELGYQPRFSSLDGIRAELRAIIGR